MMNRKVLKTVYFVRHGESQDDSEGLHQRDESPLSEYGREQAHFLGERFKNIDFDVLISSPIPRALQTAEAISKATGAPIEISNIFREKKFPSEIGGEVRGSEEPLSIIEETHKHFHDSSWRYSDEETFEELSLRGDEALSYIEGRSEEKIVFASHGGFIRMILAKMIFGKKLDSYMFENILKGMQQDNTGITMCKLVELKTIHWVLLSWNDRLHLGEIG